MQTGELVVKHHLKIWLLVPLLITIAGCSAGRSFEYRRVDEIPAGPGLFSNSDDGYDLMQRSGQTTDVASSNQRTLTPAQLQEYKAFKAWQQRKAGSQADTDFKQWQEWQAYRAWKKQQQQ